MGNGADGCTGQGCGAQRLHRTWRVEHPHCFGSQGETEASWGHLKSGEGSVWARSTWTFTDLFPGLESVLVPAPALKGGRLGQPQAVCL